MEFLGSPALIAMEICIHQDSGLPVHDDLWKDHPLRLGITGTRTMLLPIGSGGTDHHADWEQHRHRDFEDV